MQFFLGRFLFGKSVLKGKQIMTTQSSMNQLQSIAQRISEMRQIMGYTYSEMAEMTEVSEDTYRSYETGTVDLPLRLYISAQRRME